MPTPTPCPAVNTTQQPMDGRQKSCPSPARAKASIGIGVRLPTALGLFIVLFLFMREKRRGRERLEEQQRGTRYAEHGIMSELAGSQFSSTKSLLLTKNAVAKMLVDFTKSIPSHGILFTRRQLGGRCQIDEGKQLSAISKLSQG